MKTMTLIALLLFSFSVQAEDMLAAAKFESCRAAAQSAVIAHGVPDEEIPAMSESIDRLVADEGIRNVYRKALRWAVYYGGNSPLFLHRSFMQACLDASKGPFNMAEPGFKEKA